MGVPAPANDAPCSLRTLRQSSFWPTPGLCRYRRCQPQDASRRCAHFHLFLGILIRVFKTCWT